MHIGWYRLNVGGVGVHPLVRFFALLHRLGDLRRQKVIVGVSEG